MGRQFPSQTHRGRTIQGITPLATEAQSNDRDCFDFHEDTTLTEVPLVLSFPPAVDT
jgi:hypothetical protein